MKLINPDHIEITHACLFAGAGGLSLGLNNGHARIGRAKATMRCLGGIDSWPIAVDSFSRITNSRGILMDLFERDDYIAFHGREPPPGWREATPADVLDAFGECPDILASSPPCKGISGLLNAAAAASPKYQALNRLVVRGIALALEAFKDDPPALIVLENVPRIQTRGRELLDVLKAMLRGHGYEVNGFPHDCGELGGLGQHRDRYLLVARHTQKVPPFLYQPPKQRVKSIGEIIGSMPMPETAHLGPMHRLPRLTWMTWLRLALIPAGKDWRALHELSVQDGYLRDIGIVPIGADWRNGPYGVQGWDETSATVAGESLPTNGQFSVADPRVHENWRQGVLGVRPMDETSGAVTGKTLPGNGAFSIADPRCRDSGSYQPYGVVSMDEASRCVTAQAAPGSGPYTIADPRLNCDVTDKQGRRHNNVYALMRWTDASGTVTGGTGPAGGGLSVADPRVPQSARFGSNTHMQEWNDAARTITGATDIQTGAQLVADPRMGAMGSHSGKMAPQPWTEPSRTVTGTDSRVGSGAQCIADPRFMNGKSRDGDWSGGGQYGVEGWANPAKTIAAKAKVDTGYWSVADPRVLPQANFRPDTPPLIISFDDAWHRPLTTLELALLQGYPLYLWDGSLLSFAGKSDANARQCIGNSVPPPAAQAIADEMARTLLLTFLGVDFVLSAAPIWVQPFAAAVSMTEQWEGA